MILDILHKNGESLLKEPILTDKIIAFAMDNKAYLMVQPGLDTDEVLPNPHLDIYRFDNTTGDE